MNKRDGTGGLGCLSLGHVPAASCTQLKSLRALAKVIQPKGEKICEGALLHALQRTNSEEIQVCQQNEKRAHT